MLKFYSKYELQWKILATAAALFVAMDKFFFRDDPGKRNWNLFGGIIFSIIGIVYLFEVIEMIKKRKTQKPEEKGYRS